MIDSLRRAARLARLDARRVWTNVVTLVVFVGIVAVPSLYAWFNIAGSWDPYGNTGNVKVAVASEDEGYSGELVGVSVNLGERVIDELRASDTIDYVVTSADDAVDGVRSGAYYAAIVLPKDFSRCLMTMLSSSPERAQVRFYQNEKDNAIASIVTDKAKTAVLADINRGFASSVTAVGAGVLDELGRTLDSDELASLAGSLDATVVRSADALRESAADAQGLLDLLEATQGLLGSSADTADAALAPVGDASGALEDAARGLSGAGQAIDGAASSVEQTLSSAAASLDGVEQAIDDAFSTAGAQQDHAQKALADADAAVKDQLALVGGLKDSLSQVDGLLASFEESLPEGSAARERVSTVRAVVSGLAESAAEVAAELEDLSAGIERAAQDLASGASNAEQARDELKGLADQARDALAGASERYDTSVRGSLEGLAGDVADAATQADGIEDELAGALGDARDAATGAEATLGSTRSALEDAASQLSDAAKRLDELHARLRSALDSADVEQLRSVLAAGPSELAGLMAAPVSIERTAVFPVDNNGSAMAPFYTTLAIWIGGVVLVALVLCSPSEQQRERAGCSPREAYLGRLALFCGVGLAQALLIAGGDLLFLGVQCEHPTLFVLACCVSSLVYVNVIFSLSASFGEVGKAVAVVLMVIQVAGSGGTFPPQMLPTAFQEIYRWLPFVHSEMALRAAMFGLFEGDFWRELAVLLAYLVPALALGLVLRRPLARMGERFERRLERTRLM